MMDASAYFGPQTSVYSESQNMIWYNLIQYSTTYK
jgi:hypothetical protein